MQCQRVFGALLRPWWIRSYRTLITHRRNDHEHDDFAGVIINAGKSINVREMIIIWLWFLIIHSEIFIERFLAHIPGACDENKSMTMNGTIYASFIMIIGVVLIDMVYR